MGGADQGQPQGLARNKLAYPNSLLSNAGQLPPLPDLPGLTVRARSFALCPTEVQPLFTVVTGHADGLAINLNHNVRQFLIDAADAVARFLGLTEADGDATVTDEALVTAVLRSSKQLMTDMDRPPGL